MNTTPPDKTPPYVIDFDDIRKGMTIEREWTVGGEVHYRAAAVADHLTESGTVWLTPDGYLAADRDGPSVLRVLPEPPVPALPTEGYIEAWGPGPTGEIHLLIAKLNADGYWRGLTEAGKFAYLSPSQITCWRRVEIVPADDPTAPKTDENAVVQELKRAAYTNGYNAAISAAKRADDGLRERMQVLAEAFEASGNTSGFDSATAAWHSAARKLRDALTETGADA